MAAENFPATSLNELLKQANALLAKREEEKQAFVVPALGGKTYSAAPRGIGVGGIAGWDHLAGVLPLPYVGLDIGGPHTGLQISGPLPGIGIRSGMFSRPPGLHSQSNYPRSLWKALADNSKDPDQLEEEQYQEGLKRFRNLRLDEIEGAMPRFHGDMDPEMQKAVAKELFTSSRRKQPEHAEKHPKEKTTKTENVPMAKAAYRVFLKQADLDNALTGAIGGAGIGVPVGAGVGGVYGLLSGAYQSQRGNKLRGALRGLVRGLGGGALVGGGIGAGAGAGMLGGLPANITSDGHAGEAAQNEINRDPLRYGARVLGLGTLGAASGGLVGSELKHHLIGEPKKEHAEEKKDEKAASSDMDWINADPLLKRFHEGWVGGSDYKDEEYGNALRGGAAAGGAAGLLYEALRGKSEEEKKQQLGQKILRYLRSGGVGALAGAGVGGAATNFKGASASYGLKKEKKAARGDMARQVERDFNDLRPRPSLGGRSGEGAVEHKRDAFGHDPDYVPSRAHGELRRVTAQSREYHRDRVSNYVAHINEMRKALRDKKAARGDQSQRVENSEAFKNTLGKTWNWGAPSSSADYGPRGARRRLGKDADPEDKAAIRTYAKVIRRYDKENKNSEKASAFEFGSKVAFNLPKLDLSHPMAQGGLGGAALGAGLGGLAGLINPGEDENGKRKSRLMAALKGALGGGVLGGGAGAAAGHFAPGTVKDLAGRAGGMYDLGRHKLLEALGRAPGLNPWANPE